MPPPSYNHAMMQLRPALETSPVQEILARLDELATIFRDSAAEGDRLARLPKYVVRALVQHGLFRLWIPKRCAGFELDLPEALQIYEAAARLDGSIGWAVMIGSGGGLFAAYLDASTANAIFARPEAVIAGSGAPDGRAQRERGGYRVSGCWHYASGAHYATTFTANCLVMEGSRCGIRPACAVPAVMTSKCAMRLFRRIAASRYLRMRRASRALCIACLSMC